MTRSSWFKGWWQGSQSVLGRSGRSTQRRLANGRHGCVGQQVETVESRELLSVSALFIPATGELNLQCDSSDSMRITAVSGNVVIEKARTGGAYTRITNIGTVPAASVQSIFILGGDDANTIDLNGVTAADFTANPTIQVEGANGHDTIIGSPDLPDLLSGGDGDDTIDGQGGDDTLLGGNGDDSITASDGNDSIRAGDGADTITGDAGSDSIDCGDGDDTVTGGDDNDSIYAGNGQDSITGDAGDDTLNGDGGTDTISGDIGNDSILGGEFADSIQGGDGADTILGQAGDDTIDGGAGDDNLRAGGGNDSVIGGFGFDLINGDAGNDTLLGNDGNDTLLGGAGRDSLDGNSGDDQVKGQGGRDTVIGGGGSDLVDGGDDNDLVQSTTPDIAAPLSISIDDDIQSEGSLGSPFGLISTYQVTAQGGGFNSVQTAASEDFDGDGDIDVAIPTGTGDVRIMLNDGVGNFSQGQLVATSVFTVRGMTAGDFDGDTDIDIALTSFGQMITILSNNGDGTFVVSGTMAAPLTFSTGIDAGDIDGSGSIDLVVANANNTVSFFRNDGSGNFVRTDVPVQDARGNSPDLVVVDDVNGDGDLDVVVTFGFSNTIGVLLNTRGNFGVLTASSFGGNAVSVTSIDTLDLDNDGDRDIALTTQSFAVAVTDQVVLLRNNGNGRFTQSDTEMTTNSPTGQNYVASGDFNADGNVDVFVGNAGVTLNAISTYLGNGDGTIQPPVNISLPLPGDQGGPLVIRDFNGDGLVDIAQINDFGTEMYVALNEFEPPLATLTVNLSAASNVPVTVSFATADGTAMVGTDYVAASGTLLFLPGETTKTITVTTRIDSLPEPSENFYVNLSGATNAVIADGQGQVLILDDDNGPLTPTLSINDVLNLPEASGNATFTVRLSSVSATPVTVNFSTADGTAVAGADYTATTGRITFAPGAITQTITIPVSSDSRVESTENFFVNLSNPVGAVMFDSRGQVTIIDDDVLSGIATLIGGEGDDTLIGSDLSELINGGGGNDLISGGAGDDTLFGGSGIDTILGGEGNDTIDGQGGADSLDGEGGEDAFVWNGAASGNDTLFGAEGLDTASIMGTGLADTIAIGQIGTELAITSGGARLILADSSDRPSTVVNVVINGLGGNDTLTLASVNNVRRLQLTLNGGVGNDLLDATGANIGGLRVSFNGDAGNDTINGSVGGDTINGGSGDDSLCGLAGNDTLIGATGNDSIGGGQGNDSINGGDGADSINGQQGDDRIDGGLGNDSLKGDDGNDTLLGGVGDDNLNGMAGDDSILGGVGVDALIGGVGNDTLDGGRNDDTISGNAGDDKIRGDHGNDYINAGDGNNTINGGHGDDTIVSGLGNDVIDGDDGNDRINAGDGNDVIVGGDGNDSLQGGGGQDIILGGDGDDSINGQGATDTVAGNQGLDVIDDPIIEIDESFVLPDDILAILNAM